jgi:RNA polymerase sigma-70 factor, ECF subfamily
MKTQAAWSRSPTELSDAEVIAAVLAGDRRCFAVLVRRHNQTMFRACRAVARNDQDAEDAVQVAWINAFRALAGFRADASVRTWLTRIAVNEAASRLRHHRRFTEVAFEDVTADEATGPEHAAMAEELGRLLEREIDALPEGMRAVLVLRDVIELDTSETAACLGIEEDNVRVRLHRARQAVGARLATAGDGAGAAMSSAWRFDGARCARVLAYVMAKLAER